MTRESLTVMSLLPRIAILCTLAVALPTTLASVDPAFGQDRISVRGTVVDDETGEPITALMIQAGKIDPDDPDKITWGFSESRSRSDEGRFRTNINIADGWTARVVVDGYVPQPIELKDLPVGADSVDIEVRLKRGKVVIGRVIDHAGDPVVEAKVFAVGPRGLNLYQGEARNSYDDEIDSHAAGVKTDAQGRFEIASGEAVSLAVSSQSFDAFAISIAEIEEADSIIQLPEPVTVRIVFDIEGAEEETEVFYQFLTHRMEGYDRVQSTRQMIVKNGDALELKSMTPGKYQFARMKMHHYAMIGNGAMIDRQFVELESGETREISFTRPEGNHASGMVRWDEEVVLAGLILEVQEIEPIIDPFDMNEYITTLDSQLIVGEPGVAIVEEQEAAFKTEALAPGRYRIVLSGYDPIPLDAAGRLGWRLPKYTASKEFTIVEGVEVNMLVLELEESEQ